jgi:predicted AlkP superfamily phosphohydrolase/phosphomutase
MTKVLIIGIDGLDSLLLSKFEGSLQNFKTIKEKSPPIKFQSIFPPDSSTAWASIYTGLEPAKHGVVFFKDPLNPQKKKEVPPQVFEKTFWRIAEQKGKKVCALYPFLPIDPKYSQVYPPHLLEKYDFVKYEPLPLYSSLNLKKIIHTVKKRTSIQAKLGLDIYKDSDWDVFFIYFPDLDNIEHIFWRYYDEEHAEYLVNSPYKGTILKMYEFFDKKVISKFLSVVKPDTVIIVLSDHGHTQRPINVVNINKILERSGFLVLKEGKWNNIMPKSRKTIIKLMNEIQILHRIVAILWKFLPKKSKELYMNTMPIDYQNTIAALSEPGQIEGLKTYNYAGIRIRKNVMSEKMYEEIRRNLINIISEIKDPIFFEKIVEWCCRREDLYSGRYISNYPDIVFKLKDRFGVGADLDCPIFSSSYSHRIYSGMHKMETPVFLINLPEENVNVRKREMRLTDVSPTVLDIIGVKVDLGFDGESILKKEK